MKHKTNRIDATTLARIAILEGDALRPVELARGLAAELDHQVRVTERLTEEIAARKVCIRDLARQLMPTCGQAFSARIARVDLEILRAWGDPRTLAAQPLQALTEFVATVSHRMHGTPRPGRGCRPPPMPSGCTARTTPSPSPLSPPTWPPRSRCWRRWRRLGRRTSAAANGSTARSTPPCWPAPCPASPRWAGRWPPPSLAAPAAPRRRPLRLLHRAGPRRLRDRRHRPQRPAHHQGRQPPSCAACCTEPPTPPANKTPSWPASTTELARTLVGLLARAFPDRTIHLVADAAYHGKPLQDLPERVTWTPAFSATPCSTSPRRPTGKRGRPRTKGDRIGAPAQAAADAAWRRATVVRYGRTGTVHIAEVGCLWYGAFGNRTGGLIAVCDTVGNRVRELLLFTTDRAADAEQIITRYAARWSIEVAIETAKGPLGVGQARNRVPAAVGRTVPFGMLMMSLVYCWYTRYGHHPDDVTDRRAAAPWYTTKTEPSFEDMLAKLRRTIIAARFLPELQGQPTSQQIVAVHRAWASAAA